MNSLQLLTAREQLMEDIDCIIESNFGLVDYKDEVIKQLCDAVCNNFPSRDAPTQPSKRTHQVKIMLNDTELACLEDKVALNRSDRASEIRRLIHQKMNTENP